MVMESDNEENGLEEKFTKLEVTKCTVKRNKFWFEKVEMWVDNLKIIK